MTIIEQISSVETYFIRHPVLRKGKALESCRFDGDDLPTTQHFGLFWDKGLVGIVSLFEKSNPNFLEKNQYQIRGMAILESQQKKGFGRVLILHCEKYCENKSVDLVWFNARTKACGFYEKMGYKKNGIPFEIPDVGEHILMFKKM